MTWLGLTAVAILVVCFIAVLWISLPDKFNRK